MARAVAPRAGIARAAIAIDMRGALGKHGSGGGALSPFSSLRVGSGYHFSAGCCVVRG